MLPSLSLPRISVLGFSLAAIWCLLMVICPPLGTLGSMARMRASVLCSGPSFRQAVSTVLVLGWGVSGPRARLGTVMRCGNSVGMLCKIRARRVDTGRFGVGVVCIVCVRRRSYADLT